MGRRGGLRKRASNIEMGEGGGPLRQRSCSLCGERRKTWKSREGWARRERSIVLMVLMFLFLNVHSILKDYGFLYINIKPE